MIDRILPGSTIGFLGSGQLGRMSAIQARRLGYKVICFSPESKTPTGQVADLEIVGDYEDIDAIGDFASQCDVITLEFENISVAATDAAERQAPMRPGGHVLQVAQHRMKEKTFFKDAGLPVTPFAPVRSLNDLKFAAQTLGLPGVLKTCTLGYDGKGQSVIYREEELEAAWEALNTRDAILEKFIEFEAEVSVVGARSVNGEFAFYGPFHNDHANHILDVSRLYPDCFADVKEQAEQITHTAMQALDVVGLLCVEFFVTPERDLMINEVAPRPHNSGHLTIEGCVTCQFEQHIRAVCGLPLGETTLHKPTVMVNLLGDLWEHGEPRWSNALEIPDTHLHLYGKSEARVGRKMGHITACAASLKEAEARALAARDAL